MGSLKRAAAGVERRGGLETAWPVRDALAWGNAALAKAGLTGGGLDCQLLLAQAAGVGRSELLALRRRLLEPGEAAVFRRSIEKRAERVPAAYLLGEREFWSLSFAVDHRVLIPRPETELLVETAAELLRPGCRVADVGTGSGCVIVALAGEVEGTGWVALDLCGEALAVAEENIRAHGLEARIAVVESDLFQALQGKKARFDGIVSNPPYIPSGDIARLQPEIRKYEPRRALDGGRDGLETIRRIVAEAPAHLREGGFLLLEVGDGQAERVMELAAAKGAFDGVHCRRDLAGTKRVVVARRNGVCRASG